VIVVKLTYHGPHGDRPWATIHCKDLDDALKLVERTEPPFSATIVEDGHANE